MVTHPFPKDCERRFLPVKRIAQGGYGEVWLATQRTLDRPAAVKLLHAGVLGDPEQIQRFTAEAQVTARLSHPSIVVVLDCGAECGIPWIAYEHVPGKSLRDLLVVGPLPAALAISACRQVADALDHAHRAGVLHRDIKPENVLRVDDERFKVADFGLAKWTGTDSIRTRTGLIMGTPGAMAPEVIEGQPASPASDLYSLGVLLFELLTGQGPFPADTLTQVLEGHLRTPPPRAARLRSNIPAALDELCDALLAKSPAQRPADAATVSRLLEHIGAGTGADAGVDAGPPEGVGAGRTVAITMSKPVSNAMVPTQVVSRTGPIAHLVRAVPARGTHAIPAGRTGPGAAWIIAGVTILSIATAAGIWHVLHWSQAVAARQGTGSPGPALSRTLTAVSRRPPVAEASAVSSATTQRWRSAAKRVDATFQHTLANLIGMRNLLSPDSLANMTVTSDRSAALALTAESRADAERLASLEREFDDVETTAPPVPWDVLRGLARVREGRFLAEYTARLVEGTFVDDQGSPSRSLAFAELPGILLPLFGGYLDALASLIEHVGTDPSFAGDTLIHPLFDVESVGRLFDVCKVSGPAADRYKAVARQFKSRVRPLDGPLAGPLATIACGLLDFHLLAPNPSRRAEVIRQAVLALDALGKRAPAVDKSIGLLRAAFESMGPHKSKPPTQEIIPYIPYSLLPSAIPAALPATNESSR